MRLCLSADEVLKADAKTLGEPPQFCQYDETARGYHLWQSQDDNRTSPTEKYE